MPSSPRDFHPHLRPVEAEPRPRSGTAPEVLVMGGGVIGLACARELAGRGCRVEVVERLRSGAEASTAAAGMLAPLAEAAHAGPLFDACRASRDAWAAFRAEVEEESGIDVDYDDTGALVAALAAEDEARLEELAAAARAVGEPVAEVDPAEARRQVPALSPAVRRMLHLPGDHRVDNVKLCAALARAAERRGVALSRGLEVTRADLGARRVRLSGDGWKREADRLVLAAGAWSGAVPGLPALPVRPVRGQMVLLGGVEWSWSGIVRTPERYAVRRGLTGLLVGATQEEAGFDCHTTLAGLATLFSFARRLLPGLAEARVETTWAGLRPGTPDDLPLIGPIGDLPVLAATGHYRNGILLAPWTARAIAAALLDGEAPPEARPFSPARFGAGGG